MEALHVEFSAHAPHIHAAVIMPGHVGTSIAAKAGQEVDPETGEWKQTEMSPADQKHILALIKANNPEAAKAFEGKVRGRSPPALRYKSL